MRHQLFQLAFRTVCGKVGNLRLEGYDQISRRIDDGRTEIEYAAGIAPHRVRKLGRLGVQPHTQKGAVLALGSAQLVKKFHDSYCREALPQVRFKE
jgi:hypothetical protein